MPTPAPEAARRHYLIQRALAASVVTKMRAAWQRVDINNLDISWAAQSAQMFKLLAAGQVLAASTADQYVDAVLVEQGIDTSTDVSVVPFAFAGVASDGRDLSTLLFEPVITTKLAIAAKHAPAESMAIGEAAFARVAATQIQDAGRTAVATAIAARPTVTSYTRMLNPPSCSRCIILAGKTYRWNTGFERHPHCDCIHIPSTEDADDDFRTDPKTYFNSLNQSDQDKYFTKAGAETIRQGGDMNQVVNARLGMYQANGDTFTTVGTTKRGVAGKRLKGDARLMPETILQNAGGDRDATIELLRENGYLA